MGGSLEEEAQQIPHPVPDFPHTDVAAHLLVVVLRAHTGRGLHQLKAIPQHGSNNGGLISGGLGPCFQDKTVHHLLADAGALGPQVWVN